LAFGKLRPVDRIMADGWTKITANDIEAIKDSVLAEVQSIRGERVGTSLPASLNLLSGRRKPT